MGDRYWTTRLADAEWEDEQGAADTAASESRSARDADGGADVGALRDAWEVRGG